MHYPQERWFAPADDGKWPAELLNPESHAFYNPDSEIDGEVLVDLNSGNVARGICALPYTRLRDGTQTFIPVNIIGNLYVSNGMAAGNTLMEARTQALSELFERHVKYRIISEGLCLPEVPDDVIARFPNIRAGIAGLRKAGFGILVGRVARRPLSSGERDIGASEGPGRVFQLRRASALRDRAGTRDD